MGLSVPAGAIANTFAAHGELEAVEAHQRGAL